jgi:4,5:9,10-diseco-3-hydroxy-5,9,17-trioxoandrosta-1(10),2-diene-4-oate hydrolase
MTLTAENTTKFASAQGVKIHYHEAGSGPALIMVPGTGAGASAWGQNKYNIEYLSRNFRVILYNPPPIGQSEKTLVSDAPRHPFYAQILLDFMDELGVAKANLYGGSPGGAQVIRLAVDHPERVNKLILQCVPGIGPSYFTPSPWEGARLTQVVGSEPSYENVVAQIEAMVPRPERRTDEMVLDRYNAAADSETNAARARITGPQENLTPVLGRISQPTLVIWGLHERDVPLDFGLKLAVSIPKARFHVYGHATGHFPQFERAAEFNRLVTEFLLDYPRPCRPVS